MAISFPQTNKGDFSAAAGSLAVSFASGIAAGSIIVIAGSNFFSTGVTAAISDGKGDTFTFAPNFNNPHVTFQTFNATMWAGAFFTPTTGAQTITATFSGGTNPTAGDMFIWEIAGLTNAVIDKCPVVNTANGTTFTSTSSGTLSSSSEAAVGYSSFSANGTGVTGSWTSDGITTTTASIGGHQILSSNASLAFTGTCGTSDYGALIITLMSTALSGQPGWAEVEW